MAVSRASLAVTVLAVLCLSQKQCWATFTNVPLPGVPGTYGGSVAWGDYDGNGRLDFLLTGVAGQVFPSAICQLWRNTMAGFTSAAPGSPGVLDGSVAWGDYDNDGRLDFLLTGSSLSGAATYSQVWRNTGGGFSQVAIAGLPGVYNSSAAWGDCDNDGRLDFLLTGLDINGRPVTGLWRNTGGGFSEVPIAGLAEVAYGSVAWGDFDNDGRLDFLLTGADTNGLPVAQVWRNIGHTFTNLPIPGLPGVQNSAVAWGDHDNDGRLDFLISGYSAAFIPITELWRNTGTTFTNVPVAGLPGVSDGAVAWGDHDNDGRLDLLITGADLNAIPLSELWRNTGTTFTNVPIAGLPGVLASSAAWADYEGDGRLDFLISGHTGIDSICQLWRNTTPVSNAPPTVPGALSVSLAGPYVEFGWDAATDTETPAAGLTYNVRIGTSSAGTDALAPMSLASGRRTLPQDGNAQHRLTALFRPLPGTTYHWSVQAVDTAFAGSAFSAEGTFATAIVFASTNGTPVVGDIDGDGVVDDGELNTVLSNYWPYTGWLEITNTAGLGGTNVTFALTDDPVAGAFSVEYTTNFADWFFLGLATPRYEFTDTNAPAEPQRHYRLRWP